MISGQYSGCGVLVADPVDNTIEVLPNSNQVVINYYKKLANGNILLTGSKTVYIYDFINNTLTCIYTASTYITYNTFLETSNGFVILTGGVSSASGSTLLLDTSNNEIVPVYSSAKYDVFLELSNGNVLAVNSDRNLQVYGVLHVNTTEKSASIIDGTEDNYGLILLGEFDGKVFISDAGVGLTHFYVYNVESGLLDTYTGNSKIGLVVQIDNDNFLLVGNGYQGDICHFNISTGTITLLYDASYMEYWSSFTRDNNGITLIYDAASGSTAQQNLYYSYETGEITKVQ